MTRIFVQRGSAGSSSNPARPLPTLPPQPSASQAASTSKEEEQGKDFLEDPGGPGEFIDYCGSSEDKSDKKDEVLLESSLGVRITSQSEESTSRDNSFSDGAVDSASLVRQLAGLRVSERVDRDDVVGSSIGSSQIVTRGSYPPPPPVPPPKPAAAIAKPRRTGMGGSNSVRFGPARRPSAWPVASTRSSPSGSCPSSPRSYGEGEGYNSADEQSPCFVSSYDDAEREHLFELEIRRAKGFEVKRMAEDGNCLFRAVADQVYGDSESYDMVRQLSIDYMERERDHFSQFITEGFTSYCKRKRRDKVYGNNVEIQAFAEMYNRPIHIYCYSTEPINIFHGNYDTDTPPIRLSYHHGNHYNSLVDPRRLTIGAGLGFSSLQGRNIDREQVKAAIRAQQDQQIDNALLAEGRFYSDLELTEKEIERMVMEASRAEYLAEDKLKQQLAFRETSTSGAEPSSSSGTATAVAEGRKEKIVQQQQQVLSSSMQLVLSMGFSYLQVMEAYGIFGDDVDSMVCYLLETGIGGGGASSPGRRKGKAAE